MTDGTQGPSASAGAGAGAILRLSIHRQKAINLLEQTPLEPINGKLYFSTAIPFDTDLIKVGLHTSVPANFDRADLNCSYHKNGVLIDHQDLDKLHLRICYSDNNLHLMNNYYIC